MMVSVDWFDETHRTVLIVLAGRWTWDEIYSSIETARGMMRTQSDTIIDIVVKFESSMMPHGSLSMHGAAAIRYPEPNLRRIIIVSSNRVMYRVMKVMLGINSELSKHYQVVDSMDRALAMMNEVA